MHSPPYTRETTICSSMAGPTISLLEVEGRHEVADLRITPIYDGKSIPLAPLLEWLWTNRPELMKAAQQSACEEAMTSPGAPE